MALKTLLIHVASMAVMFSLTAGCAGIPLAKSLLKNEYSEKRRQRNEEVVKNFEDQRNQASYEDAMARWEQNDSKGCREILEPLLVRDPKHIDAQLLMAEVDLLDQRYQEAMMQVDEVLNTQPANARALYTKGLVLDAMGQSTEAVSYYEQAVKAEPENEIYAACYKNAADPNGPDANISEGVVPAAHTAPAGSDKDSSFSGSYAHAESAVSAEEFISEGQRELSEGSIDAARIAFRKASSCKPNNPQIPLITAGAALRTNHPELAVELLTPAAKHFSKSAAIYRMLGVAHYRLGDYRSSQVVLQQAVSLDKSCALSYFLMGCTLAKLGQTESAEAQFQQAGTLDRRYATRR